MQASSGPDGEVRARVLEWVEHSWDPDLGLVAWRERLADAGWSCPTWPTRWGGMGLPASSGEVVRQALADAGVPGAPDSVAMHLVAPTLLAHGSDELCGRYLRGCLTGTEVWCQLFSEPGAGSDLAGLTATAEEQGSHWVVRGQKVWNTGAVQAELGLLVARTDWDVPKHAGITCFVLPMRQPGVEVRPLRQMNGHASFNEVFLSEAVVPAGHVVGQVGHGWTVAQTTLAHERRLSFAHPGGPMRDGDGRTWREAIAERQAAAEPHKWYPQRYGRVDLLVLRARATGRSRDPLVRQAVARVLAMARAAQWTAERAAAGRALGRSPGPEGSLAKLSSSLIARAAADAHALMSGAAATLSGSDGPEGGVVTEILVSVPAQSIAGGTDEIQRNIVAERVLGLPREPAPDRALPFREVPHA